MENYDIRRVKPCIFRCFLQKISLGDIMNKNENEHLEISVTSIPDDPETPLEMVNKYGTYEIQPTAETEKAFPTIAQGFPEKREKTVNQQNEKSKKELDLDLR